jgi:hypothetical protein
MQIDSGTLARGSTGNATWFMNQIFEPELIFFWVSGKVSGDTETHMAIGYWHKTPSSTLDGTVQTSNGKSSETRAKTLSHYAATTEKVAFTCTGVGSGALAGEFYLNHTAVDANYNIHWMALAS